MTLCRFALHSTVLSLCLAASACSGSDPTESLASPDEFEPEAMVWEVCDSIADRVVECGFLEVPIDYERPSNGSVQISVRRAKVSRDRVSEGTLFFNPGGPGGSAHKVFEPLLEGGYFDKIAPNFEVVSFDPRGVGESGAVVCPVLRSDSDSDSDSEEEAAQLSDFSTPDLIDALGRIGKSCKRDWGTLFDHLGSNQVVEDMESLRRAMGVDLMNFLGMSYGTRLGALYAQRYPEYTRAVILDAPVAPVTELRRSSVQRMDQLLNLNEVFFSDCDAGQFDCPEQPRVVFDSLIRNAREQGLGSEMVSTWRFLLGQDEGRAVMAELLTEEAEAEDSTWMERVPELLPDSDALSVEVNLTVHCADVDDTTMTLGELDALRRELSERSPHFEGGEMLAFICRGWPVTPDPVERLVAPDSPPLLVIGGTRDLQTPLLWAEAMERSLDNAVLLTSEHYGHVAFVAPSDCPRNAMRAYLEELILPESGTRCEG